MENRLLVDSCAWIALYDKNDKQHSKAVKLFGELSKKQSKIVLHSLVLVEMLSILKYHKHDLKDIENIRLSVTGAGNIDLAKTDVFDLDLKMWRLFESKNKLGLVDTVLLDYCLKNKIVLATFDKELEEIWNKLKREN